MVVNQSDYYNHRLPKRLNVSLASCDSCENHAQVNDIGLSAVKNTQGEIGFSLHVGGSMGVTPRLGVGCWRNFYLFRTVFPPSRR